MDSVELLKNMSILYVEDDEQAREELHDVLKRRAGKVIVCENGKEGLELYKDVLPDIILADLYMPEMDGIEMLRQIRQLPGKPAVIIISAVNDVDTIINAVDAGIDKYILKPVNLEDLLNALHSLADIIQEGRQNQPVSLGDNKKQLEAEIKKSFAAFLKITTGKGPRDVSVFIHDDQVEIVASEVLTTYERNLLASFQNIAIIKHDRQLFFSIKESELCHMIADILKQSVILKEVQINVEKDKNKIIFLMDQNA